MRKIWNTVVTTAISTLMLALTSQAAQAAVTAKSYHDG